MKPIDEIASGTHHDVEGWLNAPDEASQGLQELRERLQALAGTIGTSAKNDALRALTGSEKDIRRARQRAAADAIAAALRPLGVVLHPGAPPKRQRKTRPKAADPTTQNTVPPAPQQLAGGTGEGGGIPPQNSHDLMTR